MQEISDMFKTVDMLIKSCDVDYGLIRSLSHRKEEFYQCKTIRKGCRCF